MLADNVEAFFDTWIVRDNFVKEANSSLQAIKNKVILQKKGPTLHLPTLQHQCTLWQCSQQSDKQDVITFSGSIQ